MASKTEICNIALSHISNKEIADLDSETSEEARVCRIFYVTALTATLRDFYWPFATRTKPLTLAAVQPVKEYTYSYRYPSDCVDIKRIISGFRMDTRQSRVPFIISSDDVGLVILCDLAEASAQYTVNNVSTERFPSDFIMAFSYRLASYLVPRLANGDPLSIAPKMIQLYTIELGRARANALNEGQPDEDPASEFERARK